MNQGMRSKSVVLGIALGLWGAALPAAAQSCSADGPYVERAQSGGWIASVVAQDCAVSRQAVQGGKITVPGVEGVPAFDVALRPVPAPAASIAPLKRSAPLFVVADTHGEYAILVALLRAQGIVDAQLRWKFGHGQLVVTGDMLDRGAHQIEILWLFYKLEAEAAKAGGRVHILLGNHETMVLRGDLRYLHPRYVATARALGVPTYSAALGPNTVLGAWLRSRPAMLKLGELLLLHGGVSPALAASPMPLDRINALVRRQLDRPSSVKFAEGSDEALAMGSLGPLWYRGYFALDDKPAEASADDVARARARFGVAHILIGHTIVDQVEPLYGGGVIAVQVYPHRTEVTNAPILEGALRVAGKWYRATAQGERVLLGLSY